MSQDWRLFSLHYKYTIVLSEQIYTMIATYVGCLSTRKHILLQSDNSSPYMALCMFGLTL